MAKLPAFQFYPGDWLKDPDLSICSIFARGLLIDLLAHMWEANSRGCLTNASGKPWSDEQIFRAVGRGENREQVMAGLSELIDNGVLKRHELGYLYSARMVRDESVREARSKAGSKGGSKTQANFKQNSSKPSSKTQAKSGSSSSSSSSDKNIKPPNPLSGGTKPGDKSPGRKIRRRDMESLDRLDAWILKNLPPPHSENLRLKVLACSIHAINHGKRPPTMFLAMIEKGMAGQWTVPDEAIQEASRIIRERKEKQRRQTEPETIGEILGRKNGS